MSKIMVVDDEAAVRFALGEAIAERRHDVVLVESGAAALHALDGVDVVISDYSMPDMDGTMLLERILALDATLPVILVTGHGSEKLAVNALKRGAYDYLTKPYDNEELLLSVERAAETRRLRLHEHQRALEDEVGARIIGTSPALVRAIEAATRVASKDVTVLVRGETGTGKELFATLLHARSARAQQPLVVFNSAAIPPELAEAQLFGHAKGAFTGAVEARTGYFAQANGGTLFLDEVAELRLDVQAKLLRALQEGEIQRLGSSKLERVDVRVIAATHRDLLTEVRAGRFREDLFYRLDVVELVVPALRDRPGDIPLLAREFARKYSERFHLGYVAQLAPELLAHLEQMSWPGNVRELENRVARCIALATTQIVGLEALEPASARPIPEPDEYAVAPGVAGPTFRQHVEGFERTLIRSALAVSGGNLSETARRLQLNRASLYDKLKKYGRQT